MFNYLMCRIFVVDIFFCGEKHDRVSSKHNSIATIIQFTKILSVLFVVGVIYRRYAGIVVKTRNLNDIMI